MLLLQHISHARCTETYIADVCCMIAAKAQSEQADLGKRDRKTGYAPGEWDITKMAPKLKGQA